MRTARSRSVAALAVGVTALVAARNAMAIEEPAYIVVANLPGFELREYGPTLVAETLVDADLDGAGEEGFRRLAGYIFGKNQGARKIAMTAPVAQEPVRIAMTAPVAMEPVESGDLVGASRYRVTFTMPRAFTLETLPVPTDPRVVLRQEPPRRLAALRFSGRWTTDNAKERTRELLDVVARAGLRPAGPPVYARYNSPWSLPWNRRNEILVPVAR